LGPIKRGMGDRNRNGRGEESRKKRTVQTRKTAVLEVENKRRDGSNQALSGLPRHQKPNDQIEEICL